MSQSQPIMPNDIFLVSGGGRGITAQCAIEIARYFRCKFVLLGRSALRDEPAWANGAQAEADLKKRAMAEMQARGEKPTPAAISKMANAVLAGREIAHTVETIRAVGGQAVYVSADINDAAALQTALNTEAVRELGMVTAVLHGAGNLADKRIEQKTEADFENVYAAKVDGLHNLLSAVQPQALKTLVLFSSVAGFYGNAGQADYAIANDVLNKTAYAFKRQHPGCHVVSINWGPWEGGMVTPQLHAYFDEMGIQIIPANVGARMLVDELVAGANRSAEHPAPVQIVVGSGILTPSPSGGGSGWGSSDLKTHRLRRTLRLEDNPFLADHVVNGQAVLPMVSAMSWMASAGEGLYRGYTFFGFTNYRVLKGIVFDESFTPDYALELREVSKSAESIVLDAMIRGQSAEGKPRFHYSAQTTLVSKLPEAPVYNPVESWVEDAHEAQLPGDVLYSDGTLFHGYSFQGVRRVVQVNERGLLMRCALPVVSAEYQGQFPVQAFNYYMVDIGLQAIGVWARRIYDLGSLPLRAAKGEFYGNANFGDPFFVTMEVASHTNMNVTATITLHDEAGRVFARIADLEVTMSSRLNEMFLKNRLAQPAIPIE